MTAEPGELGEPETEAPQQRPRFLRFDLAALSRPAEQVGVADG